MEHLKRLVEQMSRDMGRQQTGFTIVTNPGKGGTHMMTITAVVAGVGVVYLRLFRGWRFTDLMYVTRSSLTKSLSQVSSGVESVKSALQTQVDSVKSKLENRLEHLRTKQAEAKAAQDAIADQQGVMASQQDNMAGQLQDVSGEVGNMHNSVRELEANLDELSFHQQTANEGIRLLCSVVGDLMTKAGYRVASVVELDKYVKRPRVSGSPRVQGLEGLLSVPERYSSQSMSRRNSSSDAQQTAVNTSEPAALLRAARLRASPDMDHTSTV